MIDLQLMIKSFNHKHIFIQTHNFPDPDAIASAYGLQFLLDRLGMQSTIVYKGKVDHGSSYAMIKRLGIKVVEFEQIKDMKEDAEIIIVDAQKGNANIIDMPGLEQVCFDHHPTYEKVDYLFSDIRPNVGACASIITEYLIKYGIAPDNKVATALLYGIKIDTANLTRGVSKLDLDMFYYLYDKADNEAISDMDNSILRREDLNAYASAINSIKIYDTIAFANTGHECQESVIAAISDFIMKLDVTKGTVVYSIKKDGIKISVRSTMGIFDAGKVANEALRGIGSGGGHEHMAGGFVPYDKKITNPGNDEKYLSELINEIEQRFINALF